MKIFALALILVISVSASAMEYGNYQTVANSLVSLKLVENNVYLKTHYCSKVMSDGSSYLKLQEDWLKENNLKINLVYKFLKSVEWKSGLDSSIRLAIIDEMKDKVEKNKEKAFCDGFYKEMSENKYNYNNDLLSEHIKQYETFNLEVDENNDAFKKLKVAYSAFGAFNFCYKELDKNENYLKLLSRFELDNKKEFEKSRSKFSNIDLLEFLKMSMMKNVSTYFKTFKEPDTVCLLLAKRGEENWFDLKKTSDEKSYNEITFILNGTLNK